MKNPKGTFQCAMRHLSDGSKLVEKPKGKWCCPASGGEVTCLMPVMKVSNMSLEKYRKSRRRATGS